MVLLVRALRNIEAKSSIHILTAFLRKQTKNTLVIRISGVRFLGENGQWGNLSELMNVKDTIIQGWLHKTKEHGVILDAGFANIILICSSVKHSVPFQNGSHQNTVIET